MTEKLKVYRSKRDFSRTAEPAGGDQAGPATGQYVMHKHAASHDHFDLRLEQDGVLRSWALPKGPSLAAGEKRLAIEVEDHPLEYGQFEGIIPPGEYGGGTIMLWDRGRWELRGKPKTDRVDFDLHGEKLRGHWTLVRMHDRQSSGSSNSRHNNWLMINRSHAQQDAPDDLSVASGRTMTQIAREDLPASASASASETPAQSPAPGQLKKSRKAEIPQYPPVQLASLVTQPPPGNDWIHEIKFDGYRLAARINQGRVVLLTRNGRDWTHRFPGLVDALKRLSDHQAIIDGEVVIPERDGSTSFRRLQEYLSAKGSKARGRKLVYQVFDLLYLDGYNMEKVPLLERKAVLEQLLAAVEPGASIRYSDHILGDGPRFYSQVCEMGLEGMISKRTDASYHKGRHESWQKSKCTQQDEFVVGAFSRPSGARQGFGSLLLGSYAGNNLVYAGRVGSGFSERRLRELHRLLKPLRRKSSPFYGDVPEMSGVQWVTPKIVVDVEFTERTRSGALRHPVFRGLREDKAASEVQMTTSGQTAGNTGTKPAPGKTSNTRDPLVAGVPITHADRILYPEYGITKLDVARYYEDVQDHILPHLVNRPLSLLRCPEGLKGDCFFQKHPGEQFATSVPRTEIALKKGGTSTYLYVRTVKDLIWLIQFGVLELHPWGCSTTDVEKPDTLIFDLDPGPDVSWPAICNAATTLRDRLDTLGLTSFLQASGGKGLHLIVPVKPEWGWNDLKGLAHGIARAHARDDPGSFTTNASKARRRGKVFIDYLRNGRGNTSVTRYSTRARENATIATPLRWDELNPGSTSNRYHLFNIRRRLSALRSEPWDGYEEARNTLSRKLLKQYREN